MGHKINKEYICLDCIFSFTIHTEKTGSLKYTFCPNCGENINVVRYEKPKEKKRPQQRVWNDKELVYIDKIINKEAQAYQVAHILNRSERSVIRRVQRRREELLKKV
jgi:uncharacterized Zn finger protein (UPF0148 family)